MMTDDDVNDRLPSSGSLPLLLPINRKNKHNDSTTILTNVHNHVRNYDRFHLEVCLIPLRSSWPDSVFFSVTVLLSYTYSISSYFVSGSNGFNR